MPKVKTKRSAKTKTVAYDVAEQLRTPEEMAAYLDAWLEEAPDDAAGIARALGDIARARGMTQVARDAGLSRESLYKALSKNGNPSFATVLKVARALGVRQRGAQPAVHLSRGHENTDDLSRQRHRLGNLAEYGFRRAGDDARYGRCGVDLYGRRDRRDECA